MKLLKYGKQYSLYFDFYPAIRNARTGKQTRREFLGMRMYVNPKDEIEKLHNKNTLLRARKICAERQQQIFDNDLGFLASDLENKDFLLYFEKLAKRRGISSSSRTTYLIVLEYLKQHSPEVKVKHINLKFVNSFREYLLYKPHFKTLKPISQNTAGSYFSKFIFALKLAYKEGLLKENIAPKIERIKCVDTKRGYLTKEEAIKLKNTPCKDELQKRICLFMIYTGLRISDAEKLIWNDLEHSSELGYHIRFQHQKTSTQQALPISEEAFALLTERGEPNERLFKGFKRKYRLIKSWGEDAGISKNIGYHIFRHSCATMLINSGVPIFTVMSILGHKEVKTTMNYLNLLDKNKIDAVNTIKL
ncbi:site-specific integrase [Flavivirga abyssicola]|uniref:tyrosine-type recombinase/integrase n=1 Tax=Flavivirga abyssicola TaxID=3063533 RepID=UPI0026DFFB05|nr:site-specific integrase [Flavivirga sp. MEBiC07777]WVK12724.1 site-specific integrase [Flavivirga sp. MEBiC07777]